MGNLSGDAQAKYRPNGEYAQHLRFPSGLQSEISSDPQTTFELQARV